MPIPQPREAETGRLRAEATPGRVPGEALPILRQAAAPRPNEGSLHDLDRVLGEARLPEPRPRLRPGTPAVGEIRARADAAASAASITSGAAW